MTTENLGRTAGGVGAPPPAGPERVSTPTGRRPLDRRVILREAVRFIDEHGRDRLTMRRLGAELGVEAMALYRYVPGREQLLDGVVEYVVEDLYGQTMRPERPPTWQEFLQRTARGVRAGAMAHPRIFPLVAGRPTTPPWLRPPLRSLRWAEGFLQGLRSYGFPAEDSVRVYRAFATFLLGHLLLEAATRDHDRLDTPAGSRPTGPADLAAYPLLAELARRLERDSFDQDFERALDDLIAHVAVPAG